MYKLFKHYNGESECCQLTVFSLLKDILTVFFSPVFVGESKFKTFTLTLKEESKNKRLMLQLS